MYRLCLKIEYKGPWGPQLPSTYPQLKFFAFHVENSCVVIAHHTEQQCGLGFALPPEESRITPEE